MTYARELYQWIVALDPAIAFLFLVPFVVAAAGLSRHWLETREEAPRTSRRPASHAR
jgi:hypothetical protein